MARIFRTWLVALCSWMLLAGCVTEIVGEKKPSGPPAPVSIDSDGWVRWMPPAARNSAAYFSILNPTLFPDVLVKVSTPRAAVAEMHRIVAVGNGKSMQRVDGIPIPAATRIELSPGGFHVMLIGVTAPLAEGEKIPFTLEFQRSGTVNVELPVMMVVGGSPDNK